jgi:hypothetical protein
MLSVTIQIVVMLIVILLGVIKLTVAMLSVVMLNVAAPQEQKLTTFFEVACPFHQPKFSKFNIFDWSSSFRRIYNDRLHNYRLQNHRLSKFDECKS